ncbi:MAG: hypothetical protein O9332_21655 [Microcystis sp. LE19-10.1B]|uniref:hypothetical protein n=1 Tax=Microcystis sp. LE19-10.1B TaxID=3016428 RepID=UPI0022C0C4D1|nr:hypothetical protein [Microcystis sp. LE19-10.1B]MCZ8027918.1 hypothetical protein [Microcystis sp. LE19-10.1B]MCZ8364467.1 hypothetical protein [Microcystis sp. LE19-251.1A]
MTKNLWTRDELLIALNLYYKFPYGQFHTNNPIIIEVAQKWFFVTWYGSIGGHKSTKSLSGKRLN